MRALHSASTTLLLHGTAHRTRICPTVFLAKTPTDLNVYNDTSPHRRGVHTPNQQPSERQGLGGMEYVENIDVILPGMVYSPQRPPKSLLRVKMSSTVLRRGVGV